MNSFDIRVIVSASIFLLVVSFVFPAVGFGANDVEQTDFPEFNTTKDQFEFLESASETSQETALQEGTLTYIEDNEEYQDNRQLWLLGDSEAGVLISLVEFNGTANPEPEVNLIVFQTSGSTITHNSRINESETVVLNTTNDTYVVRYDDLQISNIGQANMTLTVDWQILNQPFPDGTDDSPLNRIYQVIVVPINVMIGLLNIFVILKNGIFFVIDIGWFIASTYTGVVDNAPTSWAKVVMAIPGLLWSLMFVKILTPLLSRIADLIPFT